MLATKLAGAGALAGFSAFAIQMLEVCCIGALFGLIAGAGTGVGIALGNWFASPSSKGGSGPAPEGKNENDLITNFDNPEDIAKTMI